MAGRDTKWQLAEPTVLSRTSGPHEKGTVLWGGDWVPAPRSVSVMLVGLHRQESAPFFTSCDCHSAFSSWFSVPPPLVCNSRVKGFHFIPGAMSCQMQSAMSSVEIHLVLCSGKEGLPRWELDNIFHPVL
jgi:hypothetical protein